MVCSAFKFGTLQKKKLILLKTSPTSSVFSAIFLSFFKVVTVISFSLIRVIDSKNIILKFLSLCSKNVYKEFL